MAEPLVSIVMPTYRRPRLLRLALASAVGQTYGNLQIIVRDNASGDETPEVVRSFKDPRIEFLEAPSNEGVWANGFACLRRVRGDFIMSLCDDDLLGANYIETLLHLLQQDQLILAGYGATHVIDEGGAVTREVKPNGTYTCQGKELLRAWTDETIPLATGINYLCPVSFHKSIIHSLQFPDGHHSDNALFMAAGMRGKVMFTDRCVFYYRKYGGNSETKNPCTLRALGDRMFLEFLDAEVSSEDNIGLPRADWPGLRAGVKMKLACWYFAHFIRFRLSRDRLHELFWDATVHPVRTYGFRNTLAWLRINRQQIQCELQQRAPTTLRNLGRAFKRLAVKK